MLPVTHMAIAVGAVRGGERIIRALTGRPANVDYAGAIDYRFAALGSQVPDLIDKPLKYFIFPDSLPDSHLYGHTFLLPACLILIGMLLARRGDLRLLVLGIGCLTHPLVDPTIAYPRTLFWPLFGTEFPVARQGFRDYLQPALEALILITGAILLLRTQRWRDRAWAFLRTGAFPFGDEQPLTARSHR